VLQLPLLRKRPEDLVLLAEHFAARGGRELEAGSATVLFNYGWPGNVREMRTAIERAGFLSDNGTVGPRALAEAIALGAPGLMPGGGADAFGSSGTGQTERARLIDACHADGWDARRTAAALGISRTTLFRRLQACGLSLRVLRRVSPPECHQSPKVPQSLGTSVRL
jgi:transcriptional regulator of acetoin/glycerol metabolism